jgi:hypothetical protein
LLSAGPLGINVNFDFVDAIKEAQGWQAAPNASTFTQDANGWPTSDATVLVADDRVNQPWNGPDPNAVAPDISGTYHLSFHGQATVAPLSWDPLFTVQNQTYNAATNTTTADLVVAPGYEMFYIAFTNTMNPASTTGAGVTNVQLIKPGYAANTTQLFTNNLLNSLKPFSALRYLDLDGANNYPTATGSTAYQIAWSQRRLPTDYSQSSDFGGKIGESWEYMIALANATNTDMWINVPGPASDDYVKQLAMLIKNGDTVGGVTYAGLKPTLKVYLEYSNEVWGGIYNPYQYNTAAAADEVQAGGSALNNDGNTNTTAWANRRYLQRTMQITNIFRSVFGPDPTYATIRPVLGWQETNYQYYTSTFPWFESTYGPPKAFFYGMGNANYWGPSDYSSVTAAINSLIAAEPASYATTQNFTTIAAYYGLKNVAYEGGPGLGGDGNTAAGQNALAASRDPRMEAIVEQHYLNWYAAGGDLASFYRGVYGTWTPFNEWYAAEAAQAANPSLAAKYRGLQDVAASSPPTITAGIAVAPSGPTSFSATTDTLGDDYTTPYTGQSAYWLLRASASGPYDLKMATGPNGGPGRIQVFLNDQSIGTFSFTPSTTVDLGNLMLAAGFNTIQVVVLQNGWQPTTFTLTPYSTTSAASFVSADTTTEGSWKGTYGSDGFETIGDVLAPPSYAMVTPAGQGECTWIASTTDVRGLQKASAQASDRIAACWYSNQFTIDVNLTDGQPHAVSLYAVDWDSTRRSETIQVIDPTTQAVLDTRTISGFQNGVYLTWNLTGHVQFRVTRNAGDNAVISGVFFGPKA